MTRRRRLRRRGHYLVTFGLVQLLLGILAVLSEARARVGMEVLRSSPAREQFLNLLHPPVYLALSVVVFLVCIAAVTLRVPRIERFAFTGLAAMAAARAALIFVAALTTPGAIDTGLLSQGFVFLLVLRVHILIAGWSEPQKALVLDEDDWHAIAAELRRRLDNE